HDLEREIDFMKTLGVHPHILVIIGHITLECGRKALVLEYCASGDLSKWLISHAKCINAIAVQNEVKTPVPLPGTGPYFDFVVANGESQLNGRYLYEPCGCHGDQASVAKQLMSFAWQIADALVYHASRQVIHRDIAARNVLLTKDLTAKICDFGLCRRSEGNVYHTKFGKLPIRWMAPEALKSGAFTLKTD
ncbi:Protein F09A5.2, partial [Aphelenchoides avenae]